MIRVAIVASTGGSVLGAVLKSEYMRARLCTLISDRECGALSVAMKAGMKAVNYTCRDSKVFSDKLCELFDVDHYDLVVSFYTKLFRGRVLDALRGRLMNFHPSILPACPGMDGFGDTVRSGSKFIGATVHFIDAGVDTGAPVVQFATPFNPLVDLVINRHRVFVAQCQMFIQVVKWCEEGRLVADGEGRPILLGGQYRPSEFSPNLDFAEAENFTP